MEEKISYSQLQTPRITATDSKEMAFLLGKVLKEEDVNDFTLERLRMSAKKHCICVARLGGEKGQIIGTGRIVMSYSAMDTAAWLEDIALHPKFEGRGIMTALIKKLVKISEGDGATYMDLTSGNHRIRALKLYERLGFERVDTNMLRLDYVKKPW